MKFIKLLTAAHVGGRLRHPHEGVLHLNDDDAQRLLDDKAGEDVSADFKGDPDAKEAPVDSVTVRTGDNPSKLPPPEPHQSEIAPVPADETPAPAAKKAAARQE